jgi:hypothetical protein
MIAVGRKGLDEGLHMSVLIGHAFEKSSRHFRLWGLIQRFLSPGDPGFFILYETGRHPAIGFTYVYSFSSKRELAAGDTRRLRIEETDLLVSALA